jgi:exonuclease SbcD
LGRTLHGVDLIEYQRAALDQVVEIAAAECVDLIVIAGDVYDRSLPNVEAVRLLGATLSRLVAIAPVIVIPGNHDSAIRLGFGSDLLDERLRILWSIDDLTNPVVVNDEHGSVFVYGIPFLEPEAARRTLAADPEDPLPRAHHAVMAAALERVRAHRSERVANGRAVAVAHAFVVGGEPSTSERDVQMGGVDQVATSLFADFDYVALGHLHRPQQLKLEGPGVVRYSGSILRYSFSEAAHDKSVTIVDVGASGVSEVRTVKIVQARPMTLLQGLLAEVLADSEHTDDWVSVTVTDDRYPENLYSAVRQHFPHCLEIKHVPPGSGADFAPHEITGTSNPIDIMGEFVQYVSDVAPDEAELKALTTAYESALAAEASD